MDSSDQLPPEQEIPRVSRRAGEDVPPPPPDYPAGYSPEIETPYTERRSPAADSPVPPVGGAGMYPAGGGQQTPLPPAVPPPQPPYQPPYWGPPPTYAPYAAPQPPGTWSAPLPAPPQPPPQPASWVTQPFGGGPPQVPPAPGWGPTGAGWTPLGGHPFPQPAPRKKSPWGKVGVIFLALLVMLGLVGVVVGRLTTNTEATASMASIQSAVAAIRGLEFKSPVETEFLSPEEMRRKVQAQIDEEMEVSPESATQTQELLRFLGVIPPGMDFPSHYRELLGEQVLGLYDPETKKMYVVGDGENLDAETRVTVAHELTHALQDQHFDLEGISKRLAESGDLEAMTAFRALIEGDATHVMFEYAGRHLNPLELARFVNESQQSGVFDSSPSFLRAGLTFPYVQGLDFVQYLLSNRGNRGVDAAYRKLPINTQQILHPEKYERGVVPAPVALPALTETVSGVNCDRVTEGVVGEFDTRTMFADFMTPSQAERAADGWDGDSFKFADCAGNYVLSVRMRGTTRTEAAELQAGWKTYADSWSSGKGPYPAASRYRGTARVGQKDGIVTVVMSADATLADSYFSALVR